MQGYVTYVLRAARDGTSEELRLLGHIWTHLTACYSNYLGPVWRAVVQKLGAFVNIRSFNQFAEIQRPLCVMNVWDPACFVIHEFGCAVAAFLLHRCLPSWRICSKRVAVQVSVSVPC